MEQMTHFISGLTTPTCMFLYAPVGCTLRDKTNEEVKTLIENMCQDEYHSSNQGMKAKSFIAVDTHTQLY